MALNSLPIRQDGWLFDDLGADVVVIAEGGWPSTPSLRLAGVRFAPVVDGDTATWTFTSAEVATARNGKATVAYMVTLGQGEYERAWATGLLVHAEPGQGRTSTTGPFTLIIGPAGAVDDASMAAIVANPASLVAASLSSTYVAPTGAAGRLRVGEANVLAAQVNAQPSGLYALGNVSGAVAINPASGATQSMTVTAATAITPAAGTAGDTLTLLITQGPGPGWPVTWGNVQWQTLPVLSTLTAQTDVVTLLCVGAGWYGFMSGAGFAPAVRTISDTFTRADAATLGNTETGEPWTATSWGIVGNKAKPTASGTTARAIVDTGASSGVKVSVRTTQHVQLLRLGARVTLDGLTYYRLIWDTLSGSTAYIQRNNGGGQVVVGSPFSLGFAAGVTSGLVGLSVVVTGGVATIKAYRNDIEVYSITDNAPPPAATYAGVINMDANLHAVDDFKVEYL